MQRYDISGGGLDLLFRPDKHYICPGGPVFLSWKTNGKIFTDLLNKISLN
jgi:hypothetical protein